ncbi:MAG: fructoselysine 6-kinase [Lachnospiraceae bacterium]|nr:fructoselysine 6-kinase [Lachnospiraceae bacterium]
MGNKISAVAAGYSCIDVYEKISKCYPTGNGVDWGVHLQRMGIPISVVSAVGSDSYGETMKQMLEKEGIDVSHLHVKEGSTCLQKMDLIDGIDRVHLDAVEGVMEDYALSNEDKDYIKKFPYIHTDLFGNVLKDLAEFREAGVKVVLDFSVFSDDIQYNSVENFQNVDYAFLSYTEEDDYILNHIKTIQSFGPKIVTVTLGNKGSISYDGKDYFRYGIVPTKVVNTVGAGDAFIAGFTYGIMYGWTIPECQELGAKTSSKAISKFEPY